MWIAKSKYDGTTYGKKYTSIYDCQKYIDENLKEESEKHRQLRAIKIFEERYKRKPTNDENNLEKYVGDKVRLLLISMQLCNGILCYEVEQHRFCDGMDF